ncbi:MAG: hypothetical protein N839_0011890 [Desulfofustis sp. PB-SRB1]|jgi:hypothetical protein|nr:hypothetical protein [Desulfofustis sp. PB-SRB1]MBM1003098.1 hypothetical protein [Desulfofustis sp. PB-SRB1]HBH28362.1 hypothetical protein [Desulfofustis sp.]HBH31281.1 hypothetical protein [Desulfofustis sp.]
MDDHAPLDPERILPERMSVLRSLPVDIKQQLSGKEARAFLYGEELPDELLEKLKDYIMKE